MSRPFDSSYFAKFYGSRPWRRAGSKPLLDASRLRLLRRWVPSGTLLEIGLGYGAFARKASGWFNVVALDLDPDVVRRGVADSRVAGVAASAYDLPIRDASIDIVTCIDVAEHLRDPSRFFAEAHRVLRRDGYLHISVPNTASFGTKKKGKHSYMHGDVTHVSLLSREEWREKLRAAGFDEVWSGTDGLWDVPYFSRIPKSLQWLLLVGATQAGWALAPAFRWNQGENFLWLGRRRE